MIKKIFTALTALILCFVLIFSSTTIPASAYDQPNDTVESISIRAQSGVLEGETLQMQASIESSSTFFDSVEWSSSNPQAISCTKDGIIEGLIAGKSATITCKAKYGSAKDSITVYCVEKISQEVKSGFNNNFTFVYSSPGNLFVENYIKDLCFDFTTIKNPFFQVIYNIFYVFNVMSSVNSILINKITVCGKSGSYAYIRYGENNLLYGFVKNSSLKNTGNAFLTLSTNDMDVWANGIAYDHRKLTTKYKGDIEWIYDEDSDYFEFDETTGQVKGKVPGKNVTITAKADGETATCTIHLLYKWPQAWTGKTNRNTNIYYAVGNSYNKGSTSLPTGTEFVVEGDCGTSNGWAYGYYEINDEDCWGYIPISHLSTKGTISQYSSLGWTWPVRDVKNGVTQTTRARYIFSPYGWRDDNPAKHKGIDITNGISSNINLTKSIDEYEVVSAFAGTVIYVYDISSGYKSCGNCVAIRSNEKDPITGKYYVAIYMHLKYKPKVGKNQNIPANKLLGYVGDTGNSSGSHLHFEVNNQNLSYGEEIYYENNSEKEMVFGSVINPLFFYMNYYNLPEDDSLKIIVNPDCAAMEYRKPLWYGDDIKETAKP